ncbi:hypothetical protein ACIBG5_33605 [Kribbella sp. NPDC050241]|uniref:hypothetical protein n=1 Tax=Kribbella sp. NPDC050241 TaxID=3364115 RepID=UPI0037ABFD87
MAVTLLVTAIGLSSPSAAAPPPAVQPAGLERAVTLITGDRVQTSPDLRQVRFVPGPGRENVHFSIHRTPGAVFVVPSDAGRLIADDRLDRRLFDLRQMLNYDDGLPLVVTSSGPAAVRVSKAKAADLYAELAGTHRSAEPIGKIWLDDGRTAPPAASTRVNLQVVPSTDAIEYDVQRWPHTDDTPQDKTVTYTNDGDQPVPLALEAELTAPDGAPAAESAVQLSASSLTVPAHGTAEVVVTSNTNHTGPDGQYTGRLTARLASGDTLTTTLAVLREVESYDLTVRHLDRTGAQTSGYYDFLIDRDATEGHDGSQEFLGGDGSEYKVRVPKGHYLLESVFGVYAESKESIDLVLPQLDVTADRTITFDARQAKPVRLSVQDQRAGNGFTIAAFELVTPLFNRGGGIGGTGDPALFVGQIGPTVPGLTSTLHSEFGVGTPTPDGEYIDSPVVYHLNWSKLDGYFDGFTKAVRDSELATLRPTITAGAAETTAAWFAWRISPRIGIDFGETYRYTKLPATPTIRVTVADDFRWQPQVRYSGSDPLGFTQSAVTCQAGRTCPSQWGDTVVTPVAAHARLLQFQSFDAVNQTDLSRAGDVLTLSAAGADGSGHVARRTGTFTVSPDGDTRVKVPNDGTATVDVSPDEATYKLDLVTVGSPLGVSTRTISSWRFRSGTTATKTALPLWTVGYRPAVETGATHMLPFELKPLLGAKVGPLTTVGLQTSTDDGATWQPAKVRGTGLNRYVAEISTPAGAQTVSVRTTAADGQGNTVDQEIDQAYKLHH